MESNKTNDFMESRDSCSRLRMSFLFHLGQYHGWILGKRFWRALDAYSGDYGKVDKGNLFGILAWVIFEWLYQLWRVGMRILIHTWLVIEIVGDIGLEGGILLMGLASLGKKSQCSLTFFL